MKISWQPVSALFKHDFLKALWKESENCSGEPPSDAERESQQSLLWILGSAGIIIVIVVGMVALFAINRSEVAMSNLLAQKGASLLKVFESAIRTGMRGEAGLQLQVLLEEMANSQDIEFVAVTMPDGVIIAHSSKERLGEIFRLEGQEMNPGQMRRLDPGPKEKWKIIKSEGRIVFLVYRHFTMGQSDWSKDVPEPTIFLGLDVSPFEITSSQNRSYIIILSVVTLLVGLACFLALCYAQRAAESRRRQRYAESRVRRLEREMRRNEKLAAVGALAAGVAHEIRNPLSSIKGYATYFCQRFPEGSEDREAATVMVNEVNRLNRVITDLLGLSKPGEVKVKPMRIENVMAHVLRLIRQTAADKNIMLSCRLAPQIPDVMGDLERLSQALLNLCLNALDAMPNGGRLTIAVSGGRKRVCLIVRDTGIGIAPEILSRIFDPYFTTKGGGTGLGLPMTHKIIKAHKGLIDVVSHLPGKNGSSGKSGGETIFRVLLPVAG